MKNKKYNYSVITLLTAIILVWSVSCKRDFDELDLAKFPNTPEVFIDEFSQGLNYAAFGGSKVTAFDVDMDVKFAGSASMKIEVPDAGDPEGAYAGGVYYTSEGRDLSEYDALTFWAKASKSATIDLIGFGNDLGELKYLVSLESVAVNSNWKKYIIPIPDPSKLTEERGMFYYSEGPEEGLGYTFWIDEVKFEKLGTIAHKEAKIEGGMDVVESTFNGLRIPVSGVSVSFNMPTGIDKTFLVAPSYFTFSSSNTGVATVDASGVVSVVSAGTAVITAKSGDEDATGSLTIESAGDFINAPTPDKLQEDVISIFSDAYNKVPVEFYNGYWEPYQTTLSADFTVGDDDVLYYTNFNFVGIQFSSPSIDASSMTHLHMDVYIPNAVDPADKLKVTVKDMGPDGVIDTGDDYKLEYFVPTPMASQSWISVDIDLSGLAGKSKLAQLVLENDGSDLTGFYLDNVYFYGDGGGTPTGPTEPAPTPTEDPSNVISIYSDAYPGIPFDNFDAGWCGGASVEGVTIQGNNTLKKITGIDCQGINFASNRLDLSEYTHIHFDLYTNDADLIGDVFNVKLVDWAGGSGEASNLQVNINTGTTPAIVADQWVSVDIDITSLGGVVAGSLTRSDIAEIGITTANLTNVWYDNIYFYKGGGSPSAEPTVSAPTPTQDPGDVYSLFSDAYTNTAPSTFSEAWGSGTVSDFTIGSDNIKKYTDLNFQAIVFSETVDLTAYTHVHIDVWTPEANKFGVKLQDFGADDADEYPNADDSEFELESSTTQVGQTWVGHDFAIADFTGLTGIANMGQLQVLLGSIAGGTTGVAFVDNIYFYNANSTPATEPSVSAPTPSHDPGDVYSLFSDAYTNTAPSTFSEGWGSGTVSDFTIGSDNIKKYTDLNFQAIVFSETVDLTAYTHVHIDVWTPEANKFGVKLQDFGADDADEYPNADDSEFELESSTTQVGQTWVGHDFAIADFTGLTGIANVGQLQVLLGSIAGGTSGVAFVDNIYFYNDGGGSGDTGPTVAAPTPPVRATDDVISLFSGAYTDVTIDNWDADWGNICTLENIQVEGNDIKKYVCDNFAAVDFSGNKFDASLMTYFHMDLWTPTAVLDKSVTVKLVDFGGGSAEATNLILTVVHTAVGDVEALEQGTWVSVDVPISAFSGDLTRTDLAQMALTTNLGTIYVDNIYFYK